MQNCNKKHIAAPFVGLVLETVGTTHRLPSNDLVGKKTDAVSQHKRVKDQSDAEPCTPVKAHSQKTKNRTTWLCGCVGELGL